MRALAAELGIQAPTLYHHVRDKAALLDLVSAEAFRSLDRAGDGYARAATLEQWADTLQADARRLRTFCLQHPGLARAIVDHARMQDVRDAEEPHDPVELTSLIRIGVPENHGRAVIQAVARWTMAPFATEDSIPDSDLRDRLFRDGLTILIAGVIAQLRPYTVI